MIKARTLSLGILVFLCVVCRTWSQPSAQQTAIDEDIRRQAAKITLRQTLQDAQTTEQRRDLVTAAKLYDTAWDLCQQIGPGVDAERAATKAGLARTRLPLAEAAARKGDLQTADDQVRDVLRVDPTNPEALAFKKENDKELAARLALMPDKEHTGMIPAIMADHTTNAIRVQDGKLLYEMGKLDEAEALFQEALKKEPANGGAHYYLELIRQQRYKEAANRKRLSQDQKLVDVEDAWTESKVRDLLPKPNPYARDRSFNTSPYRQAIYSKLDHIRIDNVNWDGLPLSEVIKNLTDEAKKRDPERRGINFIINPNADVGGGATLGTPTAPGAIDPATGLPVAPAAPAENVDIGAIQIKLNLSDVRLADVLDAVTKVAEKHIKYSVEDYAVVFSLRGTEPIPLFTRIIKVDPNTFKQGLESVIGLAIGTSGNQGGGGGGGGGGGQSQNAPTAIPRVRPAGTVIGGQGGGAGGGGGGQGGQGTGNGLLAVTRTNDMRFIQDDVRQFFTFMGVDLNPPKSVFFNDREGTIVVRATLQDLDTIETAVQVLNLSPPQVHIKAKFVEVSQNDSKALGFDYYLGNVLMNNGTIGAQGGSAPSFAGSPTAANPAGTFPGSILGGTALAPSTTDQKITSGLRNQTGVSNPSLTPTLFTLTGILTDPQFRVVIHALEQRDGVDLLSESSVTTLSGRQTQVQTVDLRQIVTGVNLQTQTASGGGTAGGNAAATATVNYNTDSFPLGPTLDVIPYVSADGFSIQMTIIPTIVDFLGYDDPGNFVPQAVVQTGAAASTVGALPLPHFRLRQVTTSAVVWDGQTVVLGGLLAETVAKIKDKIPMLGDLPYLGRFFRSESSTATKANLMIFVTPTIIDPAGNRYHSEEEMPFAQTGVPRQPAVAAGQ